VYPTDRGNDPTVDNDGNGLDRGTESSNRDGGNGPLHDVIMRERPIVVGCGLLYEYMPRRPYHSTSYGGQSIHRITPWCGSKSSRSILKKERMSPIDQGLKDLSTFFDYLPIIPAKAHGYDLLDAVAIERYQRPIDRHTLRPLGINLYKGSSVTSSAAAEQLLQTKRRYNIDGELSLTNRLLLGGIDAGITSQHERSTCICLRGRSVEDIRPGNGLAALLTKYLCPFLMVNTMQWIFSIRSIQNRVQSAHFLVSFVTPKERNFFMPFRQLLGQCKCGCNVSCRGGDGYGCFAW
jgi:hypothetical protein